MPKQRILLDASALKEASCILRLFNITVRGLRKTQANDVAIEFGTAFHLFRKHFEEGKSMLASIKDALEYFDKVPKYTKRNKQYLDSEYLRATCLNYNQHYELLESFKTLETSTGKKLVEVKFGIPLYSDDEVEVIGCGTIDRISFNSSNGIYAISDYKTTSAWDIEEYFSSYELSPQLLFYTYVIQKYGEAFPHSIIGEVCKSTLGSFIDGIFLASGKDAQFARSRIFFHKEKTLKDFEKGLYRVIHRLVEAVKNPSEVLYKEGMVVNTCEKYFTDTYVAKCPYFNACSSSNQESYDMIIENNFKKIEYNPLKFGEAST